MAVGEAVGVAKGVAVARGLSISIGVGFPVGVHLIIVTYLDKKNECLLFPDCSRTIVRAGNLNFVK